MHRNCDGIRYAHLFSDDIWLRNCAHLWNGHTHRHRYGTWPIDWNGHRMWNGNSAWTVDWHMHGMRNWNRTGRRYHDWLNRMLIRHVDWLHDVL